MIKRWLEKEKWFFSALAVAVAAFFYLRGDKLTYMISGLTAFLGMFTVNEWGVISGIILGVATFILTWAYKQKYLETIRKNSSEDIIKEGIE